MKTPPTANKAFTLIELLTVIAIIAILMGLLFPALGGVKDSANKAKAKNDVMNIVNSVKSYYTEYGKYPVNTPNDIGFGATQPNSAIFDVLRNITTNPLTPTLNPRQVVFIELPNAKNYGTTNPNNGVDSNGVFYDPWGIAYNVWLDSDYDNVIKTVTHKYTDAGFATVNTGVMAASYGKDKKIGTNGAGVYAGSDDVISWQ